MVTPEIVRPIAKEQPQPDLKYPGEFMVPNTSAKPPQTPGMEVTGLVPVKPPQATMPVEELIRSTQPAAAGQQSGTPQLQFVPMITPPGQVPQPAIPGSPVPAVPAPTNSPSTNGATQR